MVYLVCFSPGHQKRPHAFLICIGSFPQHAHYLDSVWFVYTEEPLEEVDARLRQGLREYDRLLVVPIGDRYAGVLPAEAWRWLQQRA